MPLPWGSPLQLMAGDTAPAAGGIGSSTLIQNVASSSGHTFAAPTSGTLAIAGFGVLRATRTFTAAEIATLNSAPIIIVPAVTGQVLYPLAWEWRMTIAAGQGHGVNAGISLRYSGGSVDIADTITPGFVTNPNNVFPCARAGGFSEPTIAARLNAIILRASADPGAAGGGGAGNSYRLNLFFSTLADF